MAQISPESGSRTPEESFDGLLVEADWSEIHGGVNHDGNCEVCRDIANVRKALRAARGHAQTPAEPPRADEDRVKDLILKHFTINGQKVLLRTIWKDGIDITRPASAIMNFADDLLALSNTSTDRAMQQLADQAQELDMGYSPPSTDGNSK